VTKARACKVVSQKKSESEGKSEGMSEEMNPHIPKEASTLGVWNLNGLLNLERMIARVKTQWIE